MLCVKWIKMPDNIFISNDNKQLLTPLSLAECKDLLASEINIDQN